ncbi:hypothetical protein LTR27_005962 [Elasticomyces elasticus]|nr:hypothetical protein LTR27_005962 [Elasticomyces elasticus]
MSNDSGQSFGLDEPRDMPTSGADGQQHLIGTMNQLVITQTPTVPEDGINEVQLPGHGMVDSGSATTIGSDGEQQPSVDDPTKSHVTPACDRVLGIIELLEHILMHTDMQTLLLAQRVSRTFLNTITNSTPLQQKLFFIQQPACQSGDELILNPLILAPSIMGRLAFKIGPSGQQSESQVAAQQYNHVLFDCLQVLKSERSNKHSGIHLMLHQLLRDIDLGTAFKGWNYAGKGVVTTGSWTRMYLVQRPCIIVVKISIDPRRAASSSDSSISSIFGVDQSTNVGRLLQLPMLFKGTGTPSSNFKTRTMEDRVKALKQG